MTHTDVSEIGVAFLECSNKLTHCSGETKQVGNCDRFRLMNADESKAFVDLTDQFIS